ncbi:MULTISPECIES: hypothetical protein [unclassified Microcystis]|uniref:hypothetical protein n=1 Tax=unclassified Microcystis TaxID=2643300 RepID=UPI003CD0D502
MRNVNLNILKFLESINNFCLSLANIGLGVSILRVSFFLPSPCSHLPPQRARIGLPSPHLPTPCSHLPAPEKY